MILWISTITTTHFPQISRSSRGHLLSPAYDHRKYRPYGAGLPRSTGGFPGWCNAMVTIVGQGLVQHSMLKVYRIFGRLKWKLKTAHVENAGTVLVRTVEQDQVVLKMVNYISNYIIENSITQMLCPPNPCEYCKWARLPWNMPTPASIPMLKSCFCWWFYLCVFVVFFGNLYTMFPCLNLNHFPRRITKQSLAFVFFHFFGIPSRAQTYPTERENKSYLQKCRLVGDMLVPWRVYDLLLISSYTVVTINVFNPPWFLFHIDTQNIPKWFKWYIQSPNHPFLVSMLNFQAVYMVRWVVVGPDHWGLAEESSGMAPTPRHWRNEDLEG